MSTELPLSDVITTSQHTTTRFRLTDSVEKAPDVNLRQAAPLDQEVTQFPVEDGEDVADDCAHQAHVPRGP